MRARSKPTRLEIHRLRYNQNGRRGPLLRLGELEDQEKDLINREVLQDVRVKHIDFTGEMDEQIFDNVQMGVLAEYGVMCPHPELPFLRAAEKKSKKFGTHLECPTCGCAVFPDRWVETLKRKLKNKDS